MADEPQGVNALEGEQIGSASAPSLAMPIVNYRTIDACAAATLCQELGIGEVLAQVLVSRGLQDPDDARAFLHPAPDVAVPDLGFIEEAADLLAEAITSSKRITVHGDYDSDGVCSTTLLTRGLRFHGADVTPMVPERSDGYGLSAETVRTIAGRGCDILIAVDCGITAVDEVQLAAELGIATVIVDHHRIRPDGALPKATIVHPQMNCTDALPMCATAVAAHLLDAVDRRFGSSPDGSDGRKELSAIATVTDVMPLEGVNRLIVSNGIKALSATSLVGLQALIQSSGTNAASIDARTLGFAIGPRINAAGRVQSAAAALDLLLCDDRERARSLAAQLEAANAERRALQMDVRVAAQTQAGELSDVDGLVLAGRGWHPGVIGIVAGAIAREFHRPTVVLSIDGEEAVGSARSVPGYDVAAALDRCSGHLLRHGGHMAAAGLTLRADAIDAFRSAFEEDLRHTLDDALKVPRIEVDAYASPGQLSLSLADELELLEPCGEGNRPAVICIPSVHAETPRKMSAGKHVRFTMRSASQTAPAVAFNARGPADVRWGDRVDVLGSLESNEWQGRVEPRFNVNHWCSPQTGAVRVMGASERPTTVTLNEISPIAPEEITGLPSRITLDMTSAGPAATIAALASSSDPAAALVADTPRRVKGLSVTHGNIDLLDWSGFREKPQLVDAYTNLIILDPPNSPTDLELAARRGTGVIAPAWREAEIEFSGKIFEESLEIDTRIRPFYREIRDAGDNAFGQITSRINELGVESPTARAVRLMIAVLEECGLIELNEQSRLLRAVHVETSLEQSQTYLLARDELQAGRAFRKALMERKP